jgi:serpin B
MRTGLRFPRASLCATVMPTVVLTATLCLFVAACDTTDVTDSTETTQAPSTTETTQPLNLVREDGILLAKSDVSRSPAPAPPADVEAAATSIRDFGLDLYTLLAERAGNDNLVFSPASIVTALAMTYTGAAGTTADEMAGALHFTLEDSALHRAFNTLDTTLESRSWETKDPEGKDVGVLVKTANSLWAQWNLAFEKDFLDTLATDYGAGVRLVDYKTAAEAARQEINRREADETNDTIPELP